MTRRRPPLLLWIALLSQVLCVVSGRALVRCAEADGRSSYELSFAGCCDEGAAERAAERGSEPTLTSGEAECPACEDGLVGEGAQWSTSSAAALSLPPLAWTWSAPQVFAQPRAARARLGAPRAPPGLAALQTVVIRC